MARPQSTTRGPSTRNLDALPDPARLLELSRSLALLDSILEPRRSLRFFSFDAAWGADESLASMNSGEGDFYFIWFSPRGTVIRGFDHESPMSPFRREEETPWPGILSGFPKELTYALEEPAFRLDELTFAIWRLAAATRWQTGDIVFPREVRDPDGSRRLLWLLDGRPETYVRFAREYHEVKINPHDVARIYAQEPITPELILSLNPNAEVNKIMKGAKSIGAKTSTTGGSTTKRRAPPAAPPKPKDARKKQIEEDEDEDDLIGEAEFKVIVIGDSVKMVVGGKVAAETAGEELYDELFAQVKSAILKKAKQ